VKGGRSLWEDVQQNSLLQEKATFHKGASNRGMVSEKRLGEVAPREASVVQWKSKLPNIKGGARVVEIRSGSGGSSLLKYSP